MTNPQVLMKMVDGVEMPLTPEEVTELDERRKAWEAQAPIREARQRRVEEFIQDADRTDLMSRLQNHTPAEINAWVDEKVNDLAGARRMFKILLRMMANINPVV